MQGTSTTMPTHHPQDLAEVRCCCTQPKPKRAENFAFADLYHCHALGLIDDDLSACCTRISRDSAVAASVYAQEAEGAPAMAITACLCSSPKAFANIGLWAQRAIYLAMFGTADKSVFEKNTGT